MENPCVPFSRSQCSCPVLSSATLAAVGAVLLCLVLLLLGMATWHRRSSCWCASLFNRDRSTLRSLGDVLLDPDTTTTTPLNRETVDSSISCAVCMETQINSILMPCAHEVACMRCAQRLNTCPVCRATVSTTLRTLAADSPGASTKEEPPSPSRHAQSCLRCAASYANCVFLPCSHKVWCTECAAVLPEQCPVCDCAVTQSLRTFHKRL